MLAHLIKKTLYVGFFAFLIGNFNALAKIVFNSFTGLGLKATGSSLSADQFLQPGRLAQVGIDAGKPILQAAGQLMGFVSFFENFIQIFVLLIAWLVVLVAFFILAVQLFVTLIEFKLTTLAGFVLVPFGLFSKTAFLAERVLGNVITSGVKVLVLAVIVGIGTTLFGEFTQGFGGNQPSLEDALALVLASLSLLGLGHLRARNRHRPDLGSAAARCRRRGRYRARGRRARGRRRHGRSRRRRCAGGGGGQDSSRSHPERRFRPLPREVQPRVPAAHRPGPGNFAASRPSVMASPRPLMRSGPVTTVVARLPSI